MEASKGSVLDGLANRAENAKRKCDGDNPCLTCREWDYACYYGAREKKSRPSLHVSRTQHAAPDQDHSLPQHQHVVEAAGSNTPEGSSQAVDNDGHGLVHRMEANSNAAFVRNLS